MRVLLHSCCAPCTTFPLFLLRAEGHRVDGVFFNPNVHPDAEVARRLAVYLDFAGEENLTVRRVDATDAVCPGGGTHIAWRGAVASDLTKPGRCRLCYAHRLGAVARLARDEGYDCFTTSLLLSIYQDHEGVAAAGNEASRESGVPFLYRDFRPGYRRSREIARGRHMYMQKYCGCEFSA